MTVLLGRSHQVALVLLRTLIGWHFAYEGFYKLMLPGWTRSGERIAAWSAAGYLKGATGPFAAMFHGMAGNASMMQAVDLLVPIGLLLVGLSLLSFVPAALIAMTSFTRIVVTLSFLRHALGMPETPPNAVLITQRSIAGIR